MPSTCHNAEGIYGKNFLEDAYREVLNQFNRLRNDMTNSAAIDDCQQEAGNRDGYTFEKVTTTKIGCDKDDFVEETVIERSLMDGKGIQTTKKHIIKRQDKNGEIELELQNADAGKRGSFEPDIPSNPCSDLPTKHTKQEAEKRCRFSIDCEESLWDQDMPSLPNTPATTDNSDYDYSDATLCRKAPSMPLSNSWSLDSIIGPSTTPINGLQKLSKPKCYQPEHCKNFRSESVAATQTHSKRPTNYESDQLPSRNSSPSHQRTVSDDTNYIVTYPSNIVSNASDNIRKSRKSNSLKSDKKITTSQEAEDEDPQTSRYSSPSRQRTVSDDTNYIVTHYSNIVSNASDNSRKSRKSNSLKSDKKITTSQEAKVTDSQTNLISNRDERYPNAIPTSVPSRQPHTQEFTATPTQNQKRFCTFFDVSKQYNQPSHKSRCSQGRSNSSRNKPIYSNEERIEDISEPSMCSDESLTQTNRHQNKKSTETDKSPAEGGICICQIARTPSRHRVSFTRSVERITIGSISIEDLLPFKKILTGGGNQQASNKHVVYQTYQDCMADITPPALIQNEHLENVDRAKKVTVPYMGRVHSTKEQNIRAPRDERSATTTTVESEQFLTSTKQTRPSKSICVQTSLEYISSNDDIKESCKEKQNITMPYRESVDSKNKSDLQSSQNSQSYERSADQPTFGSCKCSTPTQTRPRKNICVQTSFEYFSSDDDMENVHSKNNSDRAQRIKMNDSSQRGSADHNHVAPRVDECIEERERASFFRSAKCCTPKKQTRPRRSISVQTSFACSDDDIKDSRSKEKKARNDQKRTSATNKKRTCCASSGPKTVDQKAKGKKTSSQCICEDGEIKQIYKSEKTDVATDIDCSILSAQKQLKTNRNVSTNTGKERSCCPARGKKTGPKSKRTTKEDIQDITENLYESFFKTELCSRNAKDLKNITRSTIENLCSKVKAQQMENKDTQCTENDIQEQNTEEDIQDITPPTFDSTACNAPCRNMQQKSEPATEENIQYETEESFDSFGPSIQPSVETSLSEAENNRNTTIENARLYEIVMPNSFDRELLVLFDNTLYPALQGTCVCANLRNMPHTTETKKPVEVTYKACKTSEAKRSTNVCSEGYASELLPRASKIKKRVISDSKIHQQQRPINKVTSLNESCSWTASDKTLYPTYCSRTARRARNEPEEHTESDALSKASGRQCRFSTISKMAVTKQKRETEKSVATAPIAASTPENKTTKTNRKQDQQRQPGTETPTRKCADLWEDALQNDRDPPCKPERETIADQINGEPSIEATTSSDIRQPSNFGPTPASATFEEQTSPALLKALTSSSKHEDCCCTMTARTESSLLPTKSSEYSNAETTSRTTLCDERQQALDASPSVKAKIKTQSATRPEEPTAVEQQAAQTLLDEAATSSELEIAPTVQSKQAEPEAITVGMQPIQKEALTADRMQGIRKDSATMKLTSAQSEENFKRRSASLTQLCRQTRNLDGASKETEQLPTRTDSLSGSAVSSTELFKRTRAQNEESANHRERLETELSAFPLRTESLTELNEGSAQLFKQTRSQSEAKAASTIPQQQIPCNIHVTSFPPSCTQAPQEPLCYSSQNGRCCCENCIGPTSCRRSTQENTCVRRNISPSSPTCSRPCLEAAFRNTKRLLAEFFIPEFFGHEIPIDEFKDIAASQIQRQEDSSDTCDEHSIDSSDIRDEHSIDEFESLPRLFDQEISMPESCRRPMTALPPSTSFFHQEEASRNRYRSRRSSDSFDGSKRCHGKQ